MASLSQFEDSVRADIDGAELLVLDFLEHCRHQGRTVRVKDMEPVLERLGIPLHGPDHFVLLLADWENCIDSGFQRPVSDLMDEYPQWGNEIRDHVRILGMISDCRDRVAERLLPWRSRQHLDN